MQAAIQFVHNHSVLIASWIGALCVVAALVVFVLRLGRDRQND